MILGILGTGKNGTEKMVQKIGHRIIGYMEKMVQGNMGTGNIGTGKNGTGKFGYEEIWVQGILGT